MPEGPEVKIVADFLNKKLENKIITEVNYCSAQRLVDFVNGKMSKDVPQTSYLPGVESRFCFQ